MIEVRIKNKDKQHLNLLLSGVITYEMFIQENK